MYPVNPVPANCGIFTSRWQFQAGFFTFFFPCAPDGGFAVSRWYLKFKPCFWVAIGRWWHGGVPSPRIGRAYKVLWIQILACANLKFCFHGYSCMQLWTSLSSNICAGEAHSAAGLWQVNTKAACGCICMLKYRWFLSINSAWIFTGLFCHLFWCCHGFQPAGMFFPVIISLYDSSFSITNTRRAGWCLSLQGDANISQSVPGKASCLFFWQLKSQLVLQNQVLFFRLILRHSEITRHKDMFNFVLQRW